ncbi:hypothetical protein ACIQC9_00945 [Brevundimonas sp. NPDC092305]|uniref:hypothetical protein n=1 Tax=Brevundimonas sp. NPDC092305 TaxID=3363957 RepID=UPI00382E8446
MFEFGRDLRKLFERARESDDLGWLELVAANLVETEARSLSIDAGRVSCAKPFDGWMRASTLWREHARRTGFRTSLDRAAGSASDAGRHASTPDQRAAAALEALELRLLTFDLFGGPERLRTAEIDLSGIEPQRQPTRAWAGSLKGRLTARQARLNGDPAALRDAAAVLDDAVAHSRGLSRTMVSDLRLERAALSLEIGLMHRDVALLDRAGRDLRAMVEDAAPEQRPLTRARALTLAAAGLSALATLAGDDGAVLNGRALFDAAADQFTPDHSPLDWVAIQLARAEDGHTALSVMIQSEALTLESGLILGALARERRTSIEVALAEATRDIQGLATLAVMIKARLLHPSIAPIDWAGEQIGLIRIARARARLTGVEPAAIGLMAAEAALTAREQGAILLAEKAESAVLEQHASA